jgi:hypothetical protein
MVFWMRAAPVAMTAIGHTSWSYSARSTGRKDRRRSNDVTLRGGRIAAPRIFRV